jgi:hypothetical protein
MSELLTTLQNSIESLSTENITVVNAVDLGFVIGDYLQINEEILQIRTSVTDNTLYVKRAALGSSRSTHNAGAAVRKVPQVPASEGTTVPTAGGVYGVVDYPNVPNTSRNPPDLENNPVDSETYFPANTVDGAIDPYDPTVVSYNSSLYKVARNYSTLDDPQDTGSIAAGKIAAIGTQDEPSQYVAVDIAVEIASNNSKNETTDNTINEYTSFYSRPKLWRTGGLYDVDEFDNAYHFRVLPFQQNPISINQQIVSGIATFYGNEKTRIYFGNLSNVELNHFVVQSTYFSENNGNRSRIVGFGSNYIDLNTEHSFVGIATTANISIVDIRTSDVETEFGYYFNGQSVNFNLVTWSYGFYYGDANGIGLSNCSQPTHRRWGVFVETPPWNPCDPNSGCVGQSSASDINEAWNFFEDLTLFGDYRNVGSADEFHPEPLVQILRPKHAKRGLYVKDTVGIGIEPDRRIQLYVDNTDNPCPDKTHALYVNGTSAFHPKVGIGITFPETNLHVIGISAFYSNVGIGITTPQANLHVIGNTISTGDGYFGGTLDGTPVGRLLSRIELADERPKPFDMVHPSLGEGNRLRYACIEGPEVGVYFRGRLKNKTEIELPWYWKDLVHFESITVQLQPIGDNQDIIVKQWDSEKIYLYSKSEIPIDCFYHVYAERKDVNALVVEYKGNEHTDYPDTDYNDPQFANKINTETI